MAATDFLTEARLRGAKPRGRPYKLRDGGGLYLLVTPSGAKQWRLRYTLGGRESMLSLGTYPATSIKAARAKRGGLRSALESGRDPAAERRAERDSRSNTFESIAREWLAKQPFAPKTMKKAVWTASSSAAASMRRHTEQSSGSGRSSDMRSRPGAPSATPRPIVEAPWLRSP